jgi:hypothetical protein
MFRRYDVHFYDSSTRCRLETRVERVGRDALPRISTIRRTDVGSRPVWCKLFGPTRPDKVRPR